MTNSRDNKHSTTRQAASSASAEARERELAARKRVAALVSGGLHFTIKRQGDRVQAARVNGAAKLLARLSSKTFAPEQTLDLRGRSVSEMDDAVAVFLPVVHRRGVKQVLIPFSGETDEPREQREAGAIAALTRSSAAPLVRAFSSPHEIHGGTAALAVLLI